MKKKLLPFLITICVFLFGGLTACGALEPHTHEFTQLLYDANAHRYKCSCGRETQAVPHTGGKATCTQKAVCEICEQEYGKEPIGEHIYSLTYNEDKHWLECSCGDKKDETTHNGGTATCTQKAICNSCSQEYGTPLKHTYTLKYNTEKHWLECVCGDKKDEATHNGGAATCTQKAVCDTCKQEHGTLLEHTYCLKYNESKHWFECTCGDKTNEASHSGGTPTLTQKAVCSTCSQEYGTVLEYIQFTTLTKNGNVPNNSTYNNTTTVKLDQSKYKGDATLEWTNMTIKMKGNLSANSEGAVGLMCYGWSINSGLGCDAIILEGDLTKAMKSNEWVTLTIRFPHYYDTNILLLPYIRTSLDYDLACTIRVIDIDYTTISKASIFAPSEPEDYEKLGYNHTGAPNDKVYNKGISLGLNQSYFDTTTGKVEYVNVTMEVQGNLAADFNDTVTFFAYGWAIDNGRPGNGQVYCITAGADMIAAFKSTEWVEITIRVPHYYTAGVVLVPIGKGYTDPLTVYVKDITVDYGTINESSVNPILKTVTRKTNVASDTTNQPAYVVIDQSHYYKATNPSNADTMQWTNLTMKIRGNLASDFTGAVGFFCFGWAINNGLSVGAQLVTSGDIIREAMKSNEWTTVTIRFPKYHDTNLFLVPITSAEADYDLECEIIVVEIEYDTISESQASPYFFVTTGNGNVANDAAITKTSAVYLDQTKFKHDGTLEWVNMTIKMKGDLNADYNQATDLRVWGWAVNNGLGYGAKVIEGDLTAAMKSAEWVTLKVRVPHYHDTSVFFVPITGTNLGKDLHCRIAVVEIDYTTISESETSWTPPTPEVPANLFEGTTWTDESGYRTATFADGKVTFTGFSDSELDNIAWTYTVNGNVVSFDTGSFIWDVVTFTVDGNKAVFADGWGSYTYTFIKDDTTVKPEPEDPANPFEGTWADAYEYHTVTFADGKVTLRGFDSEIDDIAWDYTVNGNVATVATDSFNWGDITLTIDGTSMAFASWGGNYTLTKQQ